MSHRGRHRLARWTAWACGAVFALLGSASDRIDAARADPPDLASVQAQMVDDSEEARAAAAAALVDRYPDGAICVPMLIDLLDDESPRVVQNAARALDSMMVAAATPLAEYCARPEIRSKGAAFAEHVAAGLAGRAGYVVLLGDTSKWSARPRPPLELERIVAAALHPADGAQRPWEALVLATRGSNGPQRQLAAAALACFGADAILAKGIPLFAHPGRSDAARPCLVLLNGQTDVESWCGARLLHRLRWSDRTTASTLLDVADSSRTAVGDRALPFDEEAMAVLGDMGTAATKDSIQRLIESVKVGPYDADLDARCGAVIALGHAEDLSGLMEPSRSGLAQWIGAALLKRGVLAGRALATVLDAYRRGVPYVGGCSLENVLAGAGEAGAPALPLLRKKMDSHDQMERRTGAAFAILAIEPKDPAALAFIVTTIDDPATDVGVRRAAEVRLPRMATTLPGSLELLRDWAKPDALRRRVARGMSAIAGLCLLAARARGAEGDLIRDLALFDVSAREGPGGYCFLEGLRKTIEALGRIGNPAVAAVPALEAMRNGDDVTLRVVAAQAIRRIRAK